MIKNKYLIPLIFPALLFSGCVGNMNPTGGNSTPDYPYFITTEPLIIKNIAVPTGTRLVYIEQKFKKGKQDKLLAEDRLKEIRFQKDTTVLWGGVPIRSINKFFNSAMTGYTVYANFSELAEQDHTGFSRLWQSCSDGVGITVKSNKDWSFNHSNIADVENCSVIYQRYFKDNLKQQHFLDEMYRQLSKVDSQ